MLARCTSYKLSCTCSILHAAQISYTYRAETRRQRRVRKPEAAAGSATGASPTAAVSVWCTAGRQQVRCSAHRSEEVKAMEVEVKLRLPDRAAYEKVASLLSVGHQASYAQENYFFDGEQQELNSKRAVLRLRFYNGREKATITVKGKQVLKDGIGRASEVEEEADPVTARQWLQEPALMLDASPMLKGLSESLALQSKLKCMGGFKNQREVYGWEGVTIELDETQYEWGTLYEIECETDQPEALKEKLEKFLSSNGISFSYSACSKFANFVNRRLD